MIMVKLLYFVMNLMKRELKMNIKKPVFRLLQLCICILFLQTEIAFAKTTRTTDVRIQNLTGLEIEFISVVHKYSDVFKDRGDWGRLNNGSMTKKPMKIRYNTGAFTTGQNWWFVAWKYKGNDSIQYTSPNNFRNFVDFVEQLALVPFDFTKAFIGNNPASAIGDALLNDESTVGFKKHLLRESDQKNGVIISLTVGSVKFDSATGHSSTEGIKTRLFTAEEKRRLLRGGGKTKRDYCSSAIQNKIAWDYKGSKKWNVANIKSLCGNVKSAEPAKCFNRVMHGGVNWGGGTNWKYQNAMNLCRESRNASKTIACFTSQNKKAKGQWQRSINVCRSR